jgi:DNA-binding transcriptional LysR family regulator
VPELWPLPVDIRWLESFAVVAEELHFTRAAQRLSVSQPALSQQVARLERQLGVHLFVRSPGAVSLTPAGAALWREVQPAIDALRAGIAAARVAGGRADGRLRVLHLSSYGPQVMPMVAAHLRETEPGLRVELREASIEEQLDALRRRSADVGVFHLDPDVELDAAAGVATRVVGIAPRFVALPLDHVLGSAPQLSLADLAGEPWVMPVGDSDQSVQEANAMAACRRQGFAPRVSQRANSIETMLGLVASGFGVAPAPWSVALHPPSSIHLVRVVDDQHHVVVAHRELEIDAPAVDVFVDAVTAVVGALLADLG